MFIEKGFKRRNTSHTADGLEPKINFRDKNRFRLPPSSVKFNVFNYILKSESARLKSFTRSLGCSKAKGSSTRRGEKATEINKNNTRSI